MTSLVPAWAGIVLLPVAAAAALHLMRFRYAVALGAAAFAVAVSLVFGGARGPGLAFAVLFLGVAYRGYSGAVRGVVLPAVSLALAMVFGAATATAVGLGAMYFLYAARRPWRT